MSMIDKLFESGNLIIKNTSLSTGSTLVRSRDNICILSKEMHPCLTCSKLTNRIDIYSEAYLCNDECERIFYNNSNNKTIIINKAEKIADSITKDLNNRSGISIDNLDQDIQEEIHNAWIDIVYKILIEK